jgi:glycosyltransferase involved in cell wall biosynthesis
VMLRLKSCDVFICMSGVYLEAAQFARERFGAKVVLVRGSKHILAQDEILAWQSGAERPSSLAIERELAGYELADMIDVPADHVVESFRRHSAHNIHKVRKNPYGCDLPMFPLKSIQVSTVSLTKFPNFVFSGTWCLRKGCDLLCIASERAGAKLIHVGSVGSDCPLPPNSAHFEHRGWVNVSLLASTYGDCDAMVLASREDGFGVVLAQGLASGLPIVCTSDTGGADLRHTVALTDRIVIVQSGNVDALSEGMSHIAERLRGNPPLLELTETDRTTLAWQAYGERYERLLQDLLAKQVAVI